jgi:hypothetical protein
MKNFERAEGRLWRLSFHEESRGFVWRCTGQASQTGTDGKQHADNDNALRLDEKRNSIGSYGPRNRAPTGIE